MNKVLLIIQREFLNRVQKKSFLLTTILVPLIFPAIMAVMIYIVIEQSKSTEMELVQVLDESQRFTLKDTKYFKFIPAEGPLDSAKAHYDSIAFGLVYIPPFDIKDPKGFVFYSRENATIEQKDNLESFFEEQVRNMKLAQYKVDQATLDALKTDIKIRQVTGKEEKSSNSDMIYIIGMVLGILIYMFVLIYGIQIMQGVIDEKTSKVVEVIVSSVKPFQLMLGKIIGIASVGLLQFVIWIVLSFGVTSGVLGYFGLKTPQKQMMEQVSKQMESQNPSGINMSTDSVSSDTKISVAGQGQPVQNEMLQNFLSLPFTQIILVFLFYFLGGYLLYGALFAAVGSAVDSIQDAQQFQFPVTLPLLVGYLSLFIIVLRLPHSTASFWLSIIPFTSPVAMVGRIASGVPPWELALSMGLLIAGFLFTTWIAARIYRVGILMHGTKVNYKVLAKWFMQRG
ncbi:MAG TPA: ABC transporter permease [Chryseosolibacter sp.]